MGTGQFKVEVLSTMSLSYDIGKSTAFERAKRERF
jgi:hypothetical protein